jgi:hypothetical protein
MKKQDILILLGLIGLSVGAWKIFGNNVNASAPAELPATPETLPNPNPRTPIVTINKDLVLKRGSNNPETKVLQSYLGVSQDGAFGPGTETALIAKKGVNQITLNQYPTKPNVVHGSLIVGNRLMANHKPETNTYGSLKLANGQYSNTGQVYDTYPYGDEIGTIIGITNDKINYLVRNIDFNPKIVWVRASDVVKI